jgi:hypothetical protein
MRANIWAVAWVVAQLELNACAADEAKRVDALKDLIRGR